MKVLCKVSGLRFLVAFFRKIETIDIVKLRAVEVPWTRRFDRFFLTGITILFLGCSQKISEENLKLLNGYWEIKEVILADGSTKEYNVNTSVDYIQIENKKGFRKKVQPKFNGTYSTSNDADLFVIVEANGIFAINYSAENNDGLVQQRTEELILLSEDGFTVRSADGLTYNYKRFEPINVNE